MGSDPSHLVTRGRGTARDDEPHPVPGLQGRFIVNRRLELRRYRVFSRPAWIDVGPENVVFVVPPYFGGRTSWTVPISELGVVVDPISEPDERRRSWAFVKPLVIAYLATTSPNAAPNLLLLFRHRQRIPPLRLGGALSAHLPYRRSRSA